MRGTTWTRAPILSDPNQSVTVGGRQYELFYSGAHLDVIAWKGDGAAYWIHNTLTDSIGNRELLAIAEQTEPAATPGKPGNQVSSTGARAGARLLDVVVPAESGGTTTSDPLHTIGVIGGLLALIAIPPIWFALLHRRRRVTEVHDQLLRTSRLSAELTAQLGGQGPGAALAVQPSYTKYRSIDPRRLRAATLALILTVVIALAGASIVIANAVAATPTGRGATPLDASRRHRAPRRNATRRNWSMERTL